jgi:hypothetical protein
MLNYFFVYQELPEPTKDYPTGFMYVGAVHVESSSQRDAEKWARKTLRLRSNIPPIGSIMANGPVQIKQCQTMISKQRTADAAWCDWAKLNLPRLN